MKNSQGWGDWSSVSSPVMLATPEAARRPPETPWSIATPFGPLRHQSISARASPYTHIPKRVFTGKAQGTHPQSTAESDCGIDGAKALVAVTTHHRSQFKPGGQQHTPCWPAYLPTYICDAQLRKTGSKNSVEKRAPPPYHNYENMHEFRPHTAYEFGKVVKVVSVGSFVFLFLRRKYSPSAFCATFCMISMISVLRHGKIQSFP
jgi:hypothetical protein